MIINSLIYVSVIFTLVCCIVCFTLKSFNSCNSTLFSFFFFVQNKRQEAVKTVIHCGEISPDDDNAIMQIKKLVKLPPRESISPSSDSDDDEEITRRKKRRLENLEKARQAHQTNPKKTIAVNMKPPPLRPRHTNTQNLLNEMSNCLRATDRMYTFQDQGVENRLPFSEEDDPDATQLPPGDEYEDEYSQPIL